MSTTYGPGRFEAIINRTITEIESNVKMVGQYAFANCTQLTSAKFPRAISIENCAFQGCTNLKAIIIPKCELVKANATNLCSNVISLDAKNVVTVEMMGLKSISVPIIVLPLLTTANSSAFESNKALTVLDVGNLKAFNNYCFNGNTALNTLILRKSDTITALNNVTAFQNTPFASGGTGGTIYIPKVLYDHLGDGTSLDYKAASNWSTIDGYGTITWAQIEGSQYENYYADGTQIT